MKSSMKAIRMSSFQQKIYFVLFILFSISFLIASILYAQPENIVLDHPDAFEKKQRPSVLFPHEQHMMNYECLDCHHKYENGKNVLDEDELTEDNVDIACAKCHHQKAKIDLRKAYHRQCILCHKENKTDPRMCGECHIKMNP